MSSALSSDVVSHWVDPAMLNQPAIFCCKPSRPPPLVIVASAVLWHSTHRIGHCEARVHGAALRHHYHNCPTRATPLPRTSPRAAESPLLYCLTLPPPPVATMMPPAPPIGLHYCATHGRCVRAAPAYSLRRCWVISCFFLSLWDPPTSLNVGACFKHGRAK
jgi:hypothetical protein